MQPFFIKSVVCGRVVMAIIPFISFNGVLKPVWGELVACAAATSVQAAHAVDIALAVVDGPWAACNLRSGL
jgi:hypothetical protein